MSDRPAVARILVVDDDTDLVSGLVRLLTAHGFLADGADGAAEAMSRLSTRSFDAVLSDIHMPGMGGLNLLASIRGLDLDVPVVLMTGDPSLHLAIAAVEEGAVAYLTKPISRTKLIPAVERAVQLGALSAAKRAAAALGHGGGGGTQAGDKAGLRVVFERALASVEPAFQPIVDAKEKRILAYEALLRSGERMLPTPRDILGAAERLDRVHDLGRTIRARVAEAAVALPTRLEVFVNLHPRDLLDENLYDPHAPLAAFATRTVLEITERATLDDIPDVEGRASRLRCLGYRIAVDDLGAGYSGLTSIVRLQPDVVKLDMSLVRNVDHDESRQRVVGAMVDLADRLRMQLVAEGVETAAESDWLCRVGCRVQQGYWFAKAAPVFPTVRWA